MKARDSSKAQAPPPPSADLLVCFPSRAHLKLLPKPICSPARPPETAKRHHHHHHHGKKSGSRFGVGQASPLLWAAKTKAMGSEIAEPTSPKVTCAGQIKVRHKAGQCKTWQSVMEEIEKLHNERKHKKRANWVDALGFKKDVMHFLACLRRIKLDFRCFGAVPSSEVDSDDVDDDEDDGFREKDTGLEGGDDGETSRTIFSKWFMVLQEDQTSRIAREATKEPSKSRKRLDKDPVPTCVPPPNALLLMRCRSAPAKSRLVEETENEEEEEEEDDDDDEDDDEEEEGKRAEEQESRAKLGMEEEKRNKSLATVMRCDTDFYRFSSDIAKETWILGGLKDPLSRSQSCKR
ncbi:uncharacterized protein LOC127808171 [Diospyros lotus]|uniref:uncharacterized protein LOC127808171 n=1 Tax=Diospyros lotus TaxID=55363 RepID=UPI00224F97FE|nr:uncharacterized protein LOC127808171 [Diospyros lotus]